MSLVREYYTDSSTYRVIEEFDEESLNVKNRRYEQIRKGKSIELKPFAYVSQEGFVEIKKALGSDNKDISGLLLKFSGLTKEGGRVVYYNPEMRMIMGSGIVKKIVNKG